MAGAKGQWRLAYREQFQAFGLLGTSGYSALSAMSGDLRGSRRLAFADLVRCIDEMDSSCGLVGINVPKSLLVRQSLQSAPFSSMSSVATARENQRRHGA